MQKGVLGGYLGSLAASLLIGVPYYVSWRYPIEAFGKVILEITIATALTACLLSVLSLFFARADLHSGDSALSSDRSVKRVVFGAAAGGALAGEWRLLCSPLISE